MAAERFANLIHTVVPGRRDTFNHKTREQRVGYFKHGLTCVVVDGWDKERIGAIDAWMKDMKARPTPHATVPPDGWVTRSEARLNGFVVYVIPPDGSKEGWVDSDYVDQLRRELIKFAPWDAVDVLFGGDEPEERSFTNKIPPRDEED